MPCKKEAGTTCFCLSIYYKRRYNAIASYNTGSYMHRCRFTGIHPKAGYYSWETAGQKNGNGVAFLLAFRAEARL
jgi:hypothetical protein